jgi:hypothetical protein
MSVFAAKFDSTVSYEDVHSFLSERAETLTGEIARRIRYRAALMSQALDKARRGYEPIRIDGIAEFNREYVRLLGLYAPQVIPGPGLVRQQSKPSDSVSMIFDCQPTFVALPAELRPTRFAHELGRGKSSRANYVNVQFRGWDSGLARLTDASLHRFSSAGIEAEVWIDRRSGKGGLRLAIATPPVDNQALFNVVEPSVIEGIQSAARLHAWVMDNRDLLQQLLDLSI